MRLTQTEQAVLTASSIHQDRIIHGIPYMAVLALAADHAGSVMARKRQGMGYFLAEDAITVTWLCHALTQRPDLEDDLRAEFKYVMGTLLNLRDARQNLRNARQDDYHQFIADVLAGPGSALDALIAEHSWLWALSITGAPTEAQKARLAILEEALKTLV